MSGYRQTEFIQDGKEMKNRGPKIFERICTGCGKPFLYSMSRKYQVYCDKVCRNRHLCNRKHGLTRTLIYASTVKWLKKSLGLKKSIVGNDIFFLIATYLLVKMKLNNKETIMNTGSLMNEIKSEALKKIAVSLNETLERCKKQEITTKQAMAEITAHKHIIQTIALDWTFNGVKNRVKTIVNAQINEEV